MNYPSVSILTVTQSKRQSNLKILFDIIKNQTYKNISEWLIIDNTNGDLVKFFKNPKFEVKHYRSDENKIGILRNNGNKLTSGEIIVRMDDDDYFFPSYVDHCVNKLLKSNKQVVGCSTLYIHDILNYKTYKQNVGMTVFAYHRDYLNNHQYNENSDTDDTNSFIHTIINGQETNIKADIEQLLSDNLLVKIIHNDNKFFDKKLLYGSSLTQLSNVTKLQDETIKFIIPEIFYSRFKELYQTSSVVEQKLENLEYDIVYLAGGFGIIWEPSDHKLGGSEQAIVNLSENWVKLGKRVAVYANFNENVRYNGVDYIKWNEYPVQKRAKNLVAWRKHGILLLMNNNIQADKILVDFHDNFSYTIADIEPVSLMKFFERVDYFMFKSNYHKKCFEEFTGEYVTKYQLQEIPQSKYKIILNGVRVDEFLDNTVLNNNEPNKRNPYRFCYCSSYDRGLAVILDKIWPIIYKAEPLAELHVYYGMDYIFDNNFKIQMQYLLGQHGVMDHGRQPMEMIIKEKYMSTFHMYMNDSIAEIDCISIRESLVCGCIPLISKFGVFIERDGFQFDWDPSNDAHCREIANDIIAKMHNSELLKISSEMLMKSHTIIRWNEISKKWLEVMQ